MWPCLGERRLGVTQGPLMTAAIPTRALGSTNFVHKDGSSPLPALDSRRLVAQARNPLQRLPFGNLMNLITPEVNSKFEE